MGGGVEEECARESNLLQHAMLLVRLYNAIGTEDGSEVSSFTFTFPVAKVLLLCGVVALKSYYVRDMSVNIIK